VPLSIRKLNDISTTMPTNGQILQYDTITSKYIPTTLSIPSVLNDLSDVVLTAPTLDQVLKYDGTNWVNGAGGGSGTPWS
jgi:hypothetical protein